MANSSASKNFTALSNLHPNMANLVSFSSAVVHLFSVEALGGDITLCQHYWFISTHACIIDKYTDTHCTGDC